MRTGLLSFTFTLLDADYNDDDDDYEYYYTGDTTDHDSSQDPSVQPSTVTRSLVFSRRHCTTSHVQNVNNRRPLLAELHRLHNRCIWSSN